MLPNRVFISTMLEAYKLSSLKSPYNGISCGLYVNYLIELTYQHPLSKQRLM